jgi:hypothetical protein
MTEQSKDPSAADSPGPLLTAGEFIREFQQYVADTAVEFRAICEHVERALGFPTYEDGEAGKMWSYIKHSRTDLERLSRRLDEFVELPRSELIALGTEHRIKRLVAKAVRAGLDASAAESLIRDIYESN